MKTVSQKSTEADSILSPEQLAIVAQLEVISLERYELDRRQEMLLAALKPAPKRRKTPTLKEMQDSIRTIWPDGRPRNKARK